jgi:predicted TIM-barrel fold metal-dependent hydrolase
VAHTLDRAHRGERPEDAKALTAVDCDVHPVFGSDWPDELAPYLSKEWQIRLGGAAASYGKGGGNLPGLRYQLPGNPFYPKGGGNLRLDLVDENGELPGVNPARAARELLDAASIDRAVLVPQSVLPLGVFPTPDVATAIASAVNEWVAERWLAADPRWRGTIAVAQQDPRAAAAEIEKWAGHGRFVAVFVSLGRIMMGDPHFHPIYEAAERHELPILVHPHGAEGIYTTSPATAGGPQSYHLDYRFSFQHPYQIAIANLISMGVLERFPRLGFAFTECGFAWLPDLMWRLDSYWKGARSETPWVKRRPSEYIVERIRVTTQPMIEPETRAHQTAIFEMIHAERTLMFSSDFPHWDGDDREQIVGELPESLRRRVLVENALELFGPRLL